MTKMNLSNKTRMDKQAEKSIGRVKNKVGNLLDLFLRNRNSGSTKALKAGLDHAAFPILLSGDVDEGKEILKSKEIKPTDATIVSWSSLAKRRAAVSGNNHEIMVDNSFMTRLLDSVGSVIEFLYSEIKRLQKDNKNLREGNTNLAYKNSQYIKKNSKLKSENEELETKVENERKKIDHLSQRISKLQNKIDKLRDG